MAYVLGFFAADGYMVKNKRGACFIEFLITDKELLEKIQLVMNSDHRIAVRKGKENQKDRFRLQVGSKAIYEDLLSLGMTNRKSLTLEMPNIPDRYFPDFVRGYFDGDGNVYANTYRRKNRKKQSVTLLSGFTCGSKRFLEKLHQKLKELANIQGGTLFCKRAYFGLYYSVNDSCRLYTFMYTT